MYLTRQRTARREGSSHAIIGVAGDDDQKFKPHPRSAVQLCLCFTFMLCGFGSLAVSCLMPWSASGSGTSSSLITRPTAELSLLNAPAELLYSLTADFVPDQNSQYGEHFPVRHINRHKIDHQKACSVQAASDANLAGVAAMHNYLTGSWVTVLNSTSTGISYFRTALQLDPSCTSAALNLAVSLFVSPTSSVGDELEAAEVLDRIVAQPDASEFPRAMLYRGFIHELGSIRSAALEGKLPDAATLQKMHSLYNKARAASPVLSEEYFGLLSDADQLVFIFGNPHGALPPRALLVASRGIKGLLAAKEYMTYHIDGQVVLDHRGSVLFRRLGFYVFSHMLPDPVLSAVQKSYRELVLGGHLKFGDPQATRFTAYNDPIARLIQAQYAEAISAIADRPVKPSYTYFGGYVGGSVLKPHFDRLQCEYTLTMQIDIDPTDYIWPFKIDVRAIPESELGKSQPRSAAPSRYEKTLYLRPGDGGLIWGRRVNHYRDDVLPKDHMSFNVFMHFVHREFNGTLG